MVLIVGLEFLLWWGGLPAISWLLWLYRNAKVFNGIKKSSLLQWIFAQFMVVFIMKTSQDISHPATTGWAVSVAADSPTHQYGQTVGVASSMSEKTRRTRDALLSSLYVGSKLNVHRSGAVKCQVGSKDLLATVRFRFSSSQYKAKRPIRRALIYPWGRAGSHARRDHYVQVKYALY
jgi:hypothetical protein